MPEISNEIRLFTKKSPVGEEPVPVEQDRQTASGNQDKTSDFAVQEKQIEKITKPEPQALISPTVIFIS